MWQGPLSLSVHWHNFVLTWKFETSAPHLADAAVKKMQLLLWWFDKKQIYTVLIHLLSIECIKHLFFVHIEQDSKIIVLPYIIGVGRLVAPKETTPSSLWPVTVEFHGTGGVKSIDGVLIDNQPTLS